jgi:hypothetical protein
MVRVQTQALQELLFSEAGWGNAKRQLEMRLIARLTSYERAKRKSLSYPEIYHTNPLAK